MWAQGNQVEANAKSPDREAEKNDVRTTLLIFYCPHIQQQQHILLKMPSANQILKHMRKSDGKKQSQKMNKQNTN